MAVPSRTQLKAPVEVPLGELRQHPGNPRRISDVRLEHLQRTLTAERGMLGARPLIALPDGTVIAGNQRLAAAVALGWETIPVVYADLDDEQAARWMLLDNRGFGEDDPELLAGMLRDLGEEVDLAGYLPTDVDAILRAAQPVSTHDPDAAPARPAEARSLRGVVYELGPHRVMCGSSMERCDVAALFQDELAEAMITDPPYGVAFGGDKGKNSISGDLTQAAIPVSFAVALEVLSDDARLYLFGGSGNWSMYAGLFDAHLRMQVHPIVWVKNGFVMRPNNYHSSFEMVYFGWKGRGGSSEHWFGDRSQTDVWVVSRDAPGDKVHPTQKPVEVCAVPIRNSCSPGGLIYEPFGGSGSTLIAAESLGRRCYAMELDPGYCDVIRQRYADYTDQPQYAP